MATEPQARNPYVGPRPFEPQDGDRFFGRDREASELLSLVIAHRVLVLYAQSGAGKTSLINAILVSLLQEEGFEVLPPARVRGLIPQDIKPREIANLYVFNTLISWAGDETDPGRLTHTSLAGFLSERVRPSDEEGLPAPRVLIFDQFEELFAFYPERWEDREGFFGQVRDALEADPLLRVVFVMREDYIAQLDPYAALMPEKLRTRYRLERLRAEGALLAIAGPLAGTGRSFATGVAEGLVAELLKVRVETAAGKTEVVAGEFVEPVQLQVVCRSLWRDLPPDVTAISRDHLQAFGDVDQALSGFYERSIKTVSQETTERREGKLRAWFEHALITAAGTRGTVYRGRRETGGIRNAAVDVLENLHLIRGEWRAGARWYELTHDRFIEPIKASNARWRERRRRRTTLAALYAVLVILGVVLVLTGGAIEDIQQAATQAARQAASTVEALEQTGTAIAGTATHMAVQFEIELTRMAGRGDPTSTPIAPYDVTPSPTRSSTPTPEPTATAPSESQPTLTSAPTVQPTLTDTPTLTPTPTSTPEPPKDPTHTPTPTPPPPTVSGITPTEMVRSSGPPVAVTITGQNLGTSGITARLGANVWITVTGNTATTIHGLLSPDIPVGVYGLTITNPDGQSGTLSPALIVYDSYGPTIPLESPDLVTVGSDATAAYDSRYQVQLVFLEVPADLGADLHVRIYDADTGEGPPMDAQRGDYNTTMRYTLYGGTGAYTEPGGRIVPPSDAGIRSGTPLLTATIGVSSTLDEDWYPLGPFSPDQGELVGGRRIFKLAVEGLSGDDENGYRVGLSTSPGTNTVPSGARMFAFSWVLLVREENRIHLHPYVTAGMAAFRLRSFGCDAAEGRLLIRTPLRSLEAQCAQDGRFTPADFSVGDEDGTTWTLDLGEYIKTSGAFRYLGLWAADESDQALPSFTRPTIAVPP